MTNHDNVSKFFGTVIALKDVTVRLKRGEVHCLLGDNGAGNDGRRTGERMRISETNRCFRKSTGQRSRLAGDSEEGRWSYRVS
jgi:ABC-type enterochelin transport system ATPase subunit